MATQTYETVPGSRLVIKLTPSGLGSEATTVTAAEFTSSDPAVAKLATDPDNPRLSYADVLAPGECDLNLTASCSTMPPYDPEAIGDPIPVVTPVAETIHLHVLDPNVPVEEPISVLVEVSGATLVPEVI